MKSSISTVWVLSLASLLLVSACGNQDTAAPATDSPTMSSSVAASESPALSGTVTVLAAASLTEAFTTLAKDFEKAHPGVTVKVSFGSSTTLATQIAQGASADLFAPAGEKALTQLGAVTPKTTEPIAINTLEIATAPGNPRRVAGLQSLADPSLSVVLCAATVPCGSAADTTLKKSGVNPRVVSRELDVKATLTKVTLGEADAAIVYHSDVVSAKGKVTGVTIPAADNTVLRYPLARLTDSAAAQAFASYVMGNSGQSVLTADGFSHP